MLLNHASVVEKLKSLLATTLHNLGVVALQHELAKRRVEAKRKKAQKLEHRAREAAAKADAARRDHRKRNAARLDAKAEKLLARARSSAAGRRKAVQQAKALHKKRHDVKEHVVELEKLIDDAQRNDGVKVNVSYNKLTGGTFEARIKIAGDVACAQCAKADRENYYDQGGVLNLRVPFTGPKLGRDRSDCSAEVISWFLVAKGPSPTGSYDASDPQFTGSMVTGGHQITLEQAKHCPFAYIIFGPGSGHHTEKAKGDGTTKTQGHGSGPVDEGDFYMLGGTVRAFVPKALAHKV